MASTVQANDPGNYFSGNNYLLLGLTEIEVFDQYGELVCLHTAHTDASKHASFSSAQLTIALNITLQIQPVGCTDSGAVASHSCDQLYDGLKGNAESDMWLAGAGQGYAWVTLTFGRTVVRTLKLLCTVRAELTSHRITLCRMCRECWSIIGTTPPRHLIWEWRE